MTRNLTIPIGDTKSPMRHPCVGYTCCGGFSSDYGYRPFKHASVGRSNFKRTFRKRERKAWKKNIPIE